MRTYIIKNRRNKFIIGHNGMYKVFAGSVNCLKGSLTSIWLDKWTYAPDAFKDGYQKHSFLSLTACYIYSLIRHLQRAAALVHQAGRLFQC